MVYQKDIRELSMDGIVEAYKNATTEKKNKIQVPISDKAILAIQGIKKVMQAVQMQKTGGLDIKTTTSAVVEWALIKTFEGILREILEVQREKEQKTSQL